MKAVIENIMAQIRANVPGVVTIARWNNQLTNLGQRSGYAIATPAVYIELGRHDTSDSPIGGVRFEGPMPITIRCVTGTYTDDDDEAYQDDDVITHEDLSFAEDVHAALDLYGWQQPENEGGAYSFTSLTLISKDIDKDYTGLRVDILEYTTELVDCSAYQRRMGRYISRNVEMETIVDNTIAIGTQTEAPAPDMSAEE